MNAKRVLPIGGGFWTSAGVVGLMLAGLVWAGCAEGTLDPVGTTGNRQPATGNAPGSLPPPPAGVPAPPPGVPTPPAGAPRPPAGTPTPPAGAPTPPAGVPTPPAGVPTPPTSTPMPPAPPTGTPPAGTPPAGTPPGMVPPSSTDLRPQIAVLVVGNSQMLVMGDTRLRQFIESRSFVVFVVDDADNATEARDAGVVVISASVNPATVAAKYRDLPVPVVVMESGLFDDMGMTGAAEMTDFGATNGQELNIAGGHPAAAGLTGRVAISAMAAPLSWGRPTSSAAVIATLANDAQRAAVFAYADGAAMAAGAPALAKRVGFFATETMINRLNEDGLKLLEAAIEWAWTR